MSKLNGPEPRMLTEPRMLQIILVDCILIFTAIGHDQHMIHSSMCLDEHICPDEHTNEQSIPYKDDSNVHTLWNSSLYTQNVMQLLNRLTGLYKDEDETR